MGSGRGTAGTQRILLSLILVVWFHLACSAFPPAVTRQETLENNVRQFHVSLLAQDISVLTRCLPAEERAEWDEAFACYFRRFRVIDFVINEVRFDEESLKANATVTVTDQALNRLVTEQKMWRERWRFADDKWRLDTDTEALRKIREACHPGTQGDDPGNP